MSIKIMNLVWEAAPYRGNTLLTLLALADWSNDEGVSWPYLETLAEKSRQSERSAQYAIELLQRDQMVTVELNPGRGNRNEFLINTQKLHLLQSEKRCKTQHEKVQFTTGKGAKRGSVIRKNHQEPSENHQGSLPLCTKCSGMGVYEHKGHPGKLFYCWCPSGVALQKSDKQAARVTA